MVKSKHLKQMEKKVNHKYLNALDNVDYIGFFDHENFVIQTKNNELIFIIKTKF